MARFQDTFVGARVYNNANIAVADDTAVTLTFNTERYDTDTIHSTGANTDRLTCVTAGKYIVSFAGRFESNATGWRRIAIASSTGVWVAAVQVPAVNGDNTRLTLTTIYDFAIGEYVTISVRQNSGGALNIESVAAHTPEFMMHRIAP